MFTCEPYDLNGESFADMLADLHPLGLAVYVTGWALWHPTVFTVIVKRDDGKPKRLPA